MIPQENHRNVHRGQFTFSIKSNPTSPTRVSLYTTLLTQIHCGIHTNTSGYSHKYISVFSHGCGSPVPGYINNGLATHDEREMPRHISSYCGANCANIPNMRVHIRACVDIHVDEMCTVDDDGANFSDQFGLRGHARHPLLDLPLTVETTLMIDKFMPG